MGASGEDNAVNEVDIGTAWEGLVSKPRSQLVDVRTRAEWTYVGIPDLGPLGKRAVLVEWQTFPDQTIDPHFVEHLAGVGRSAHNQHPQNRHDHQVTDRIDETELEHRQHEHR